MENTNPSEFDVSNKKNNFNLIVGEKSFIIYECTDVGRDVLYTIGIQPKFNQTKLQDIILLFKWYRLN